MLVQDMKKSAHLIVMGLLGIIFIFGGCSKNENPVQPDAYESSDISASEDAAESVAGSVGSQTGGLTDQVNDLFALASPAGLGKSSINEFIDIKEKTYDEQTGEWTVYLYKEKTTPNGKNYAKFSRTYTYQFLNKAGIPQKFYIAEGDTAYSILFNIVSGEGRHVTKHLSQELKELTGSFVATGTNTELVTVNGDYTRAAADTISTKNKTRTHNQRIELTIIDLTGPRGSGRDLSQKVSGTITGSYHAEITFDGKRGYSEKVVDKSIYIEIGSGELDINVDGEEFSGDIESGELI